MPPGATIVGIPGRIVENGRKLFSDLKHRRLPDPVAEAIRLVLEEQNKLEDRLRRLEMLGGVTVPLEDLMDERNEIVREFNGGGGI